MIPIIIAALDKMGAAKILAKVAVGILAHYGPKVTNPIEKDVIEGISAALGLV